MPRPFTDKVRDVWLHFVCPDCRGRGSILSPWNPDRPYEDREQNCRTCGGSAIIQCTRSLAELGRLIDKAKASETQTGEPRDDSKPEGE